MDTPDVDRRFVKSLDTFISILETLYDLDGANITEVASELGMAKSTAYRHLHTLERRGYLIREDGDYYVGLKFLELGEYARNKRPAYRMARTKVEEIARETDERAQFIVEEHGQAVYVHRATGEHAVLTDPGIGKRIPMHSVAAGKAILACYSRERVDEIVDRHGLPRFTDRTIVSRDALFEDLETVRERGYSFNRQENVEGLHAVGVPVKGPDDRPIGALSVSGPTHRFKGDWFEQELPNLLLGTANELELNIAHSDGPGGGAPNVR